METIRESREISISLRYRKVKERQKEEKDIYIGTRDERGKILANFVELDIIRFFKTNPK